jgi:hypothetical protein
MTGLQRSLLVAYGCALILLAAGVTALAWDSGSQLDVDLEQFRAVAFIDAEGSVRAAFTALMLVVALVGGVTVATALMRPAGPRARVVRLKTPAGDTVEITAEALERHLREELHQLPDVAEAWPRVRLGGGAVAADVTVIMHPDANLAFVSNAVAHTTVAYLREHAGTLAVHRPTVRVSAEGSPAPGVSGPGASRAAPPPPPPPPGPPPPAPRPPSMSEETHD